MDTASALTQTFVRRILAVSTLALAVYTVDMAGMSNALPTMQAALGLSFSEAQLLVNLSTIVYAATVLIMGWLGDQRGSKRALIIGGCLYMVAAAVALPAGALGMVPLMFGARIVIGLSFGLLVSPSASIISAYLPMRDLGRFMGITGGLIALIGAVSPPVLGTIIQSVGWCWIFAPPLVIAALMLFFIRRVPVQAHFSPRQRLDRLGSVVSLAAILLLFAGAQTATSLGFGAWQVWVGIAAGVVLLAVFYGIERRKAGAALMNVGALRDRAYLLSAVMMASGIVVQVYGGVMLLRILQEVEMLTPATAALAMSIMGLASAVVSQRAGVALDRRGARHVFLLASGLEAIAFLLLALGVYVRQPLALIPGLIVAGIGWAYCRQSKSEGMRRGPADQRARTSSAFSLFAQVGYGFGLAFISSMLVTLQNIIVGHDLTAMGVTLPAGTTVADLLNQAFAGNVTAMADASARQTQQALALAQAGTADAYALIGLMLAAGMGVVFLLMRRMPHGQPAAASAGGQSAAPALS